MRSKLPEISGYWEETRGKKVIMQSGGRCGFHCSSEAHAINHADATQSGNTTSQFYIKERLIQKYSYVINMMIKYTLQRWHKLQMS